VDSELGIALEAIRQKLLAQAGIHGDFDAAWEQVDYIMDREKIGKIEKLVRNVELGTLITEELYDTSHMPQNVRDGYALLQSMSQEERIQWYDDLDAICGNRLKFN